MTTPILRLATAGIVIALSAMIDVAPTSADDRPAAAADASRFAIPATDDGLPGAGPVRRQDWFAKLWTARRSAWAGRIERDQKSIVFLGDSITQGWGDDFGGRLPGLKVVNRGISGDTTRGMLIRLQEDVLVLNPKAVVLLMGTNDLADGASPEMIAGNLKLIVKAIKQHDPKTPVILCKVMPSSPEKGRPADKIQEINRRYVEAIEGESQVTVLDTWTPFADEEGNAKASEFPDLLHLNAAAYAKWAALLKPLLEALPK